MNIEKVIDNLWDLNKHGLQFKFEMEFEYGTLALDNTKMSCMGEKHGLAAAVFNRQACSSHCNFENRETAMLSNFQRLQ